MAGWVALATGYLHAYLAIYQRVSLALAGMGVGAVSPQTNAFLDGCRSGTIWACWFCGSLALLTMTFGLWHPEPGPWKNHHVAPQSTIASSAAPMGERMPARATTGQPRHKFGLFVPLAVASLEHGLDPRLVAAVMMVESSGNPAATNGRCVGLMQVNVPVWQRVLSLDEARMTEPLYNLRAGCRILRHYLTIERDDVRRALRRYHGGKRWRYAERVLKVWEGRN